MFSQLHEIDSLGVDEREREKRMKNKTIVVVSLLLNLFCSVWIYVIGLLCACVHTRAEPHILFIIYHFCYMFWNINKCWLSLSLPLCVCVRAFLYRKYISVFIYEFSLSESLCTIHIVYIRVLNLQFNWKLKALTYKHSHIRSAPRTYAKPKKNIVCNANKKAHAYMCAAWVCEYNNGTICWSQRVETAQKHTHARTHTQTRIQTVWL